MKTHLLRRFHTLRSQRGDTIVEVLIAIAIISLVLTGAYSTTHKSLIATRDSQEHSEALKLLEGQIEALRSSGVLATATPPTYAFCVNPSAPGTLLHTSTAGACTPASASGAYNYQLSIAPPVNGVYNLSATWPALGGGNSQVNLWYSFQ